MPLDVDRVAEALLEGTKALIAKSLAPMMEENAALRAANEALAARLAAVEARDVAGMLQPQIEAIARAVDALPSPPDVSGFVTKDDLAEVRAAIPEPKPTVDLAPVLAGLATKDELAEVRAAIPALPEPADLSGFATKADVDAAMPDLSPYARTEAVQEALKALPAPKDYDAPMAALTARVEALKLPEVIHGKDGAGIANVRMNADGELVVKLTNGETYTPGKVRGGDGFGFDDMAFEHDGERKFALVFSKDDRTVRHECHLPIPLDRGVWQEGKTYEQGDIVTWAGSMWIAQKDTDGKPDGGDYRLSVKKGRDGKNLMPPAPRPETVKR